MAKPCDYPGCSNPRFGGNYCSLRAHQLCRTDSQWLRRLAKEEEKRKEPKKAINKISPKRKKERSKYSILREEFFKLPENKMCRVFPWLEATDVHHSWATENERLLMVEYWIPVSRKGHKFIDDNPEIAYQKGWNKYRNQKIEDQTK